jgi:dTDP-4-dehydrorhamnose 3,5-epimerase
MRYLAADLPGPLVIEEQPHKDERGFFTRVWCARESDEAGIVSRIAQINSSVTRETGTVRGMHLQRGLHGEAKTVRCVRGSLFDVVVDLRRGSPHFGKWFGTVLSADNRRALYVPPGFAHGFQTLEDDVEAFYSVSEFYAPEAEAGLDHSDPEVGIQWPLPVSRVSDRDRDLPGLDAFREGVS